MQLQCLSEKSFNDLYEMIFVALLETQDKDNDTQFEEVRLITKSIFKYYKYL